MTPKKYPGVPDAFVDLAVSMMEFVNEARTADLLHALKIQELERRVAELEKRTPSEAEGVAPGSRGEPGEMADIFRRGTDIVNDAPIVPAPAGTPIVPPNFGGRQ